MLKLSIKNSNVGQKIFEAKMFFPVVGLQFFKLQSCINYISHKLFVLLIHKYIEIVKYTINKDLLPNNVNQAGAKRTILDLRRSPNTKST